MSKIYLVDGSVQNGKWVGETPVFSNLISQGYSGVYITVSDDCRDNPNMSSLYSAAYAAGLDVGFCVNVHDGKNSFGAQMKDLESKITTGRKFGLQPCLIFAGDTKKPLHEVQGDWLSYFGQFMDKFPYAVIGLNKVGKTLLLTKDSAFPNDDIGLVANQLVRARLWYFRWVSNLNMDEIAPWTSLWCWGAGLQDNRLMEATPPVSDVNVKLDDLIAVFERVLADLKALK